MAKPNYGFEKRQRELAKKRKKEEKALKKASPGDPVQGDPGQPMPPAEGAAPQQQPQD
ncbi:hypothetical protein [Ramlibacter sp. AN1133]|uniref:hypothetical protein n=1 Tax=Ramlibacter sp. AN1133 TaxID=3133429 RepID=UPI0030BD296C